MFLRLVACIWVGFSSAATAQVSIIIDGSAAALPTAERLKQEFVVIEPGASIYIEEGSAPSQWVHDLSSGRIDVALVSPLPAAQEADLSGFKVRTVGYIPPSTLGSTAEPTKLYFVSPLATSADVERFVTFSLSLLSQQMATDRGQ